MQSIDTLIHARWVIPVEPDGVVLEHHSIAIHEGRILAVEPREAALRRFHPDDNVDLSDHVLIPGFVNTHTHAAMSLLRGLADDLPLMQWLNEHIWPAEQRWVSEALVHDGTQLAIAEMLRGGTTAFNDMYFFPDVTAQCAAAAGIRACVGLILVEFPSPWAAGSEEYLRKGLELHDEWRSHPLVRTAFAPHAPYTVADASLQRIAVLADELEIPIHMHVHETAAEVEEAAATTGMRPLERLERLGLLSPALLAVHMTQLTTQEIERLAAGGCQVVHCPESNLKLASGFCPVQRLLQAGVNVALGTDGAASNNDLDMLGELRTAALLGKAVAGDASALPAMQALRMATLNGATALGLGEETGSLVPGKSADIVAICLGEVECQPHYHPVSQLVYATGRDKVTDVWVRGRQLLRRRTLTTLDEQAVIGAARAWAQRIGGV